MTGAYLYDSFFYHTRLKDVLRLALLRLGTPELNNILFLDPTTDCREFFVGIKSVLRSFFLKETL